jgi:hypothetical protein
MKSEEQARARVGIAFIAEESLDAGGFVKERERAGKPGGEKVRKAGGVATGLFSDGGQGGAGFFGFDIDDGLPVNKKEVIAGTGFKGNFAQGNSATGGEINRLVILNNPAAGNELGVDLTTGELFRGVRHGASQWRRSKRVGRRFFGMG